MSFKIYLNDPTSRATFSRETAAEALAVANELLERGGEAVTIEGLDGLAYKPSLFDEFMQRWNKPDAHQQKP